MDWFPLLNSLRIAGISTSIIFFAGLAAAYYIAKTPPAVKGLLDVMLTLPAFRLAFSMNAFCCALRDAMAVLVATLTPLMSTMLASTCARL